MNNVFSDAVFLTLYTMVIGVVGTGAGGLLVLLAPNSSKRSLAFIMGLSAGLMLAIVSFDMLPEAFSIASPVVGLSSFVAGVLLMFIITESFAVHDNTEKGRMVSLSLLMALGIALHNLPEGLAIGSGFECNYALGFSLSIAIFLHDLPEGLAVSAPLRAAGWPVWKAIALAALTGIPMGVGGLIGAVLGSISSMFVSVCLGLAGGAMLYVVIAGLLPESNRSYQGRLPAFGCIGGFIAGLIITGVL